MSVPPVRRRRVMYARRRRFMSLGLVATILLVVLGWRLTLFWHRPLTDNVAAAQTPEVDHFTMLVLGADDRPGVPGRSDTMMLAFVDLPTGSFKLLSLPRDSYTEIPEHGWDKLNAAYAFGKTPLARKTVENLIGIPIDYTLTLNTSEFAKVVDAVGGVDINVEADMDYEDPYDNPPLKIHLKKGEQHLDGEKALHYVRFRHDAQSDWGRMKRQQTFLKALVHAAERPVNLTRIPELLKLVSQSVDTQLSLSQLSRMALAAKGKITDAGITGDTLTGNDLWTPQGYYLGLNFQEMRTKVREMAGAPNDAAAQSKDAQDAAAYDAALPAGSREAGDAPATGIPVSSTSPSPKPGPVTPIPPAGPKPPSPDSTTPDPTAPWPLVVVDGSGGKKDAFITSLSSAGFRVTAVQHAAGVQQSTIVWYGGTEAAANRLKELLPQARFLHLAPGPGDPPLKLIVGPK